MSPANAESKMNDTSKVGSGKNSHHAESNIPPPMYKKVVEEAETKLVKTSIQVIKQRVLLIQALLQLNDGRDKILKCVQYFLKVLLWSKVQSKKTHPFLHPRISTVASNFSTTRKILRLGHVVEPYLEIHSLMTSQYGVIDLLSNREGLNVRDRLMKLLTVSNAVVCIVNDVVDDVICLAKIGALDKKWVQQLDMMSSRLWMSSILMDMNDNYQNLKVLVKREIEMKMKGDQALIRQARDKKRLQVISFVKLMSDFGFCYVDVMKMSGYRADGIQAMTGFLSGLLSLYKLGVKHQLK